MNEDALKRLMQRQRPSVPPRTDELETNPVVVKSGCLFAWLRQNDVYFGTPTLKSEIRVY